MQKVLVKNLIFDFGGVIVDIERDRSVNAFLELGLKEAENYLDPYHQNGFFLELEEGRIDADRFCELLGALCGRYVSFNQAKAAWMAFITDVPEYRLEYLESLADKYKLFLLSNTNPFIMDWARSPHFSRKGKRLDEYFNKMFLSYELKCVKPGTGIFQHLIAAGPDPRESVFIDDGPANIRTAHELGFMTLLTENGKDWRNQLGELL
jgi:putative hydrolase of the HAD superfamily